MTAENSALGENRGTSPIFYLSALARAAPYPSPFNSPAMNHNLFYIKPFAIILMVIFVHSNALSNEQFATVQCDDERKCENNTGNEEDWADIQAQSYQLNAALKGLQGTENETPTRHRPGAKFATVFGKDNRSMVTEFMEPFTYIGRYQTEYTDANGKPTVSNCTATLVGECLIVTVAHCLKTKMINGKLRIKSGRFTPQFGQQEAYYAHLTSTSDNLTKNNLINHEGSLIQEDWAVIQLNGHPGKRWGNVGVHANWLKETKGYTDDRIRSVKVAGYSDDIAGSNLTFDFTGGSNSVRTTKLNGTESKPIFCHKSDVNAGASGGPIFADTGKGLKIVGVHSRSSQRGRHLGEDEDDCNIGIPSDYFFDEVESLAKLPCPD